MSAVMSTGRSRRSAPSCTACSTVRPAARSWLKYATITTPFNDRHAEERDEADRGRHREIEPGSEQTHHAADQREGNIEDDRARPGAASGRSEKHEEDERDRYRHHQREARGARAAGSRTGRRRST